MLKLSWTRLGFAPENDAIAVTDSAVKEARVRSQLAVGLALVVSLGGTGRPEQRPCVTRSEEGGYSYRAFPPLLF